MCKYQFSICKNVTEEKLVSGGEKKRMHAWFEI